MPYQARLAIGVGAKRYRIANAVLVYRDARRFIQEIAQQVASHHTKLSYALERGPFFIHTILGVTEEVKKSLM